MTDPSANTRHAAPKRFALAPAMAAARVLLACMAVIFAAMTAMLGSAAPAAALGAIEVGKDAERIDIAPFATVHRNAGDRLQIETAPGTDGLTDRLSVTPAQQGSTPTWVAFALRNVTDTRVERWLVADRYSLFGSGIIWPRLDTRQIEQVTPSIGFLPEVLSFDGADVYRLTIEPGQTVTFVVEMATDNVPRLNVWRGLDYEKRSRNRQLLFGILLGITGLLAVFLSAVFAANHKAIFPSAAVFTWCVFAYLCVDFGFWHKLFTVRIEENAQYRAASEAAVAATLLLFTHTFLRLGAWHGFARLLLRLWILAQVILIGVAFLDPKLAATFARLSFGLIFVLGSLFILYLALRGQDRALSLVPTWLLFGVWLTGMLLVLTGRIPNEAMATALVSGLVLIVLLIGFTVTQYAFRAAEPLTAMSANDQALRLVALDNAGAAVWEWSARRDEIKTGQAMEAALGLSPGDLNTSSKVFLERMHPVDRDRLRIALETIKDTADGEIRLEFRMRHADDDYRWFELEAAPDPGADRRRIRCVGLVREITDRKLAADRLTYDAVHDTVTSLPNRALFLDRLQTGIARARTEPLVKPTAVVIDVDRLKGAAKDQAPIEADGMLIAIARRLQHLVGTGETLARIGSDQFGILLLHERSDRELQMFAESVRLAVRSVVRVGQRDITPTAAIGYATFDRNASTARPSELLEDAEIAMHRARRAGRDQVLAFVPGMRADRNERAQLEAELRAAIDKKQLEITYQPIQALRGRQVYGFEAIVKWVHPRLGAINPADFMPEAEDSDLVLKLGSAVVSMAAADAQRWHKTYDRPEQPFALSINISRRQLMSAGLAGQIRQILSVAGLPKGSVRLEVAETLVMENPERAAAVLEDLAAAGVGLSLDDFGTGYSSLTYLNIFPFDTIKVDRALVQGASQTGTAPAILRSVIALAHELGKKVVAEGVETEEDAVVLRTLGCEFAQGDYFGAPLGQRDVLSLLKDLRKEERKLKRGGLLRLRSRQSSDTTAADTLPPAADAPPPIPKTAVESGQGERVPRRQRGNTVRARATDADAPAAAAVARANGHAKEAGRNGVAPMVAAASTATPPPMPKGGPAPVMPLHRRGVPPPPMPGDRDASDGALAAAQASFAALDAEMGRALSQPPPFNSGSADPAAAGGLPPDRLAHALRNSHQPMPSEPPRFEAVPAPETPTIATERLPRTEPLPRTRPTTPPDFSQLPPEIANSLARLAGRTSTQPITPPLAATDSAETAEAIAPEPRSAAKG